ncbi:hypothetical protein AB4229_09120 [Vibrio breoganii]
MTNAHGDGKNEFLEATISVPNQDQIETAVKNYQSSINVFFSTYEADSKLIYCFDKFNVDDEELVNAAQDILKRSNYEVSALNGENIILFNEPMLVSEIIVSNLPYDEAAKNIRLISHSWNQKKSISKIKKSETVGAVGAKKGEFATQKWDTIEIYDHVLGIIIPERAKFQKLSATPIERILSDSKHLEKLQSAYANLKHTGVESSLLWQASLSKAKDLLREGSHHLTTAQNELHQLTQAKEFAQEDLDILDANVAKLKALDEELQESVAAKRTESNTLTGEYSSRLIETNDLKKAQHELKETIKSDRDELTAIRDELNKAKQDKLLSNYEAIAHTKEAGRQSRWYYGASATTLGSLSYFVHYLYRNAVDFEELLPQLTGTDVSSWDVLISRLPMVTATGLIIGSLSALLFFLIRQIVTLNKEKMTMLKAGILAQQAVDTLGVEGKDSEEIIQIQRDFKIKLISEVFDKQSEHHKDTSIKELISLVKTLKD